MDIVLVKCLFLCKCSLFTWMLKNDVVWYKKVNRNDWWIR